MKRMFAMLLAALLALTGGAAWAEKFPSITVTGAMTVDLEAARAVLEGLELGEEHASLLEGLLCRMDGSRDSLVLADEGFQYDVTLDDGAALSFAGEKTGDGFAVVSTLFPNYVVTIDRQTIDQFMEQFMANMPGGQGGMGDAGRGGSHQGLAAGIILADGFRQPGFDAVAYFRCAEDETVVAVDGALDATGPGKRLLRSEKDGADGEQVAGYTFC